MGIYRLPNRVVTEAQTSCPLRAKGLSTLAWGNRPRHSVAVCNTAEGAL